MPGRTGPLNRVYERDCMTKKHSPANVPGTLRVRAGVGAGEGVDVLMGYSYAGGGGGMPAVR